MDDNIYRLHPTFFGSYGLNEFRNFNHRTMTITLEDEDELVEYMASSLMDHGCAESAFFAVKYDGGAIICHFTPPVTMLLPEKKIKKMLKKGKITQEQIDEQERYYFRVLRDADFDMRDFAEFDGEMRLCCYALMVENEPGKWTVLGHRFEDDDDEEDEFCDWDEIF